MYTLFYSLGVVYVLLSLLQRALPQAYEEPVNEEVLCPPLTDNSARAVCQTEDGAVTCDDDAPRLGLQARLVWKKNVVSRNNKRGPTNLVCDPSGVWRVDRNTTIRKTTIKPDAPGYTVIPGFNAYKFIRSSSHAEHANITCFKEGTRLLNVDSMAELKAVFTIILEPEMDAFRGVGLFLGVRQNRQGLFKTDFGDSFPGTSGLSWAPGEPSSRADEGCVFINVPDFRAQDMPCVGHAANIVCERPVK